MVHFSWIVFFSYRIFCKFCCTSQQNFNASIQKSFRHPVNSFVKKVNLTFIADARWVGRLEHSMFIIRLSGTITRYPGLCATNIVLIVLFLGCSDTPESSASVRFICCQPSNYDRKDFFLGITEEFQLYMSWHLRFGDRLQAHCWL